MAGFMQSIRRLLSRGQNTQHQGLPICEALEGRLLLAGTIEAVLAGGTLTLVGDELGNRITVTALADGKVRVTGDGTTINGAAQYDTPAAVTGDIRIYLKGDNDYVRVDGVEVAKSLTIDSGDGGDTVLLDTITVNKKVYIQGGTGNDSVDLSGATVEGDVTLADTEHSDYSVRDSHFKRNLIVVGSDALGINDSFSASDLIVDGNVTVNNGDGNSSFRFTMTDGAPAIGGNLTIRCGEGSDYLDVISASVNGAVSAEFGLGSGDHILNVEGSTVGKGIKLANDDGMTSLLIRNGSSVTGNVSFKSGTDDAVLAIDHGDVAGNITFASKTGYAQFDARNGFSITGNLKVQSGDRTSVTLANAPIEDALAGGLSVKGGAGSDSLMIVNVSVGGKVALSYGDGGSTVTMNPAAHLQSSLSLKAGVGVDTMNLLEAVLDGKATISTGDGDDLFMVNDTTFNAAVAIYTGDDADTLDVEMIDTFAGQVTAFEQGLTLSCGDGGDIVALGNAGEGEMVAFGKASTLDGGAGDDTCLTALAPGSMTPTEINFEDI